MVNPEHGLWLPSLYKTGIKIEDAIEYEIVGIYSTLRHERSDNAIAPNIVFVPDNSIGYIENLLSGPSNTGFTNSFEAPILVGTVVIPNGGIRPVQQALRREIGSAASFFRFYDQGYGAVHASLSFLHSGMGWVLVFSSFAWLICVFIFTSYFVKRKKLESMLLHNIGISRRKRFTWIFIQSAIIIIFAYGIVINAIEPLYGGFMDTIIYTSENVPKAPRYMIFLDDEYIEGTRNDMPLSKSPAAPRSAAIGSMILLLGVSAVITVRISKIKSLNDGKDVA
jgi:hypothetical protein